MNHDGKTVDDSPGEVPRNARGAQGKIRFTEDSGKTKAWNADARGESRGEARIAPSPDRILSPTNTPVKLTGDLRRSLQIGVGQTMERSACIGSPPRTSAFHALVISASRNSPMTPKLATVGGPGPVDPVTPWGERWRRPAA